MKSMKESLFQVSQTTSTTFPWQYSEPLANAAYQPVETTPIASWPTGPLSAKHKSKSHQAIVIIWDVFISLIPLTFIVIAFCALGLDGHTVSQYGSNIFEAQKLGPTIFPVVFAAILGRFMIALSRWRAERGGQLGLLEQLNGSQSLSTAIERVFTLRRWGPTGICIIILWLLSPLGGQSSLRLVTIEPAFSHTTTALRYLNTNMTFTEVGADTLNTVESQVGALLEASLLASPDRRRSPSDAWNNVKIPMIETLPSFREDDPANPWLVANPVPATNVSSNTKLSRSEGAATPGNITYASLVGVSVIGLPQDMFSGHFLIEASYMSLQCSPIQYADISEDEFYERVGPLSFHTNGSQLITPSTNGAFGNTDPDYFIDFPKSDNPHPTLIWGHQHEGEVPGGFGPGWAWTTCTMGSRHVEANISCAALSCAATHIRRSLVDQRPIDTSFFPLDPGSTIQVSAWNMFTVLPYISNQPPVGGFVGRNAVLAYLIDPGSVIYLKASRAHSLIVKHTPPADFSIRLSQILNSYLQLYWAGAYISGGAPSNISLYGNQTEDWFVGREYGDDSLPFPNNVSTSYNTFEEKPVYASNRSWIAVLLFVSIIMLLSAAAGTLLKYRCRMPNVLGYVSSMTRDNPFVQVPPGGTMLDGLERARLLSDMYVQLGDVRPEEPVGHIALTSAVSRNGHMHRTRTYL